MLTSEPTESRYFAELAYHGKAFAGWQIQKGALTVQEYLNQAFSTLLKEPVALTGCGRTDSGVHASHFVAHFNTHNRIEDPDSVVLKMRRFLREDVRVDRIVKVRETLNARFHAQSRTYHYLIDLERNPFYHEYSWGLTLKLDLTAMQEACSYLTGTQDFTSFCKLHSNAKSMICTVTEAEWQQVGGFLVFRVTADRFLRNMVRALVGTLTEVGRGKIRPDQIPAILEARDRGAAGTSVPAHGLFLTRVEYNPDDFRISPVSPFPDLFK